MGTPKGQLLPFAVNLFDAHEGATLAPRGMVPEGIPEGMAEAYQIKIGHNPVTGSQSAGSLWKDIWWWLALGALGDLTRPEWVCLQSAGFYLSNNVGDAQTMIRSERHAKSAGLWIARAHQPTPRACR